MIKSTCGSLREQGFNDARYWVYSACYLEHGILVCVGPQGPLILQESFGGGGEVLVLVLA
jgi:hypothetical protein